MTCFFHLNYGLRINLCLACMGSKFLCITKCTTMWLRCALGLSPLRAVTGGDPGREDNCAPVPDVRAPPQVSWESPHSSLELGVGAGGAGLRGGCRAAAGLHFLLSTPLSFSLLRGPCTFLNASCF